MADCENIAVSVDEATQSILFDCMAAGQKYHMNMKVFKPIVKDESRWNLKGRNVLLNVSKKDKEEEEWWPRLTHDKVKN